MRNAKIHVTQYFCFSLTTPKSIIFNILIKYAFKHQNSNFIPIEKIKGHGKTPRLHKHGKHEKPEISVPALSFSVFSMLSVIYLLV
jgi:hypothetical protein